MPEAEGQHDGSGSGLEQELPQLPGPCCQPLQGGGGDQQLPRGLLLLREAQTSLPVYPPRVNTHSAAANQFMNVFTRELEVFPLNIEMYSYMFSVLMHNLPRLEIHCPCNDFFFFLFFYIHFSSIDVTAASEPHISLPALTYSVLRNLKRSCPRWKSLDLGDLMILVC